MVCILLAMAQRANPEFTPGADIPECMGDDCGAWCPNPNMANGGECALTAIVSKLHRINGTLDNLVDQIQSRV